MNASRGFLELLVCAFHPTSRPVAAHPDGDASTPLIRSNAWEIPPPSDQSPWRHATCTRAQAATAKVCLRRLHLRRRPTNVFGLPSRTRPAVKNSYQRQFDFSIYGSCERERAAVRRSPGYQQTLVSCLVSAPNPRSSASAKPATCKRADPAPLRPAPTATAHLLRDPPVKANGGETDRRWIFIGRMCER